MGKVVGTITVSRDELVQRIKAEKRFFAVKFIKRSTKSLRTMICRNKVTKHLKGGQQKYNPSNHDLITTYSMDSKDYRNIAIEGLVSARIGGKEYVVQSSN
jgi:hypothetical protein